MKLNEIFNNKNCFIFKVINFYDVDKIEEWVVEKTDYHLVPESNEDLWDAHFIVKAILSNNDYIEECYIDICIPERVSEFVFRNKENIFTIENAIENNLKAIPAVASEQYGDAELYYLKENPKLGIEILKKGKEISKNPSAIIDDLSFIYEELGKDKSKSKIVDVKDALNKFSESAILYTELEGGENHKLLNKQFVKISNCAGFLKKNNELYELKQFLEDKNLGVVAWAAYFLLTVDEELAIKKLKMIEDANIPNLSNSAKYTLKEWESGNLNIYFGK